MFINVMDSLKLQIDAFKVLNDKCRNDFSKFSSVKAPIKKVLTQFGKNSDGPLKIKGRLLTAGTYRDADLGHITILPEDLKQSMSLWSDIPIYTTHKIHREILEGKDPSVRDILGKIVSVSWNTEDDGLDFVAEIVDQDVAAKIKHGLVKNISAGFMREIVPQMGDNMKVTHLVKNIEPGESSLVFDPRDPQAEFKAVM